MVKWRASGEVEGQWSGTLALVVVRGNSSLFCPAQSAILLGYCGDNF